MKRTSWVTVLSLVAVLGLSLSASATTLIKFTTIDSHDSTYDSFYAGVYKGTINGKPADFICDDFLTEINYGQSWYAHDNTNKPVSVGPDGVRYAPSGNGIYHITNPFLLSGGNPIVTQQEEYNMIAWLVGQIFSDTNNADHNWASLAGAIWSTADGAWNNSSYTSNNGGSHSAAYYVGLAFSHKDDSNLPQYAVYTPFAATGCGQSGHPSCNGQEFWAPAQEPTVALLLGATFLGVGLMGKRVFGKSRV
jgi:hypothetical protein